MKKLFTKQFGTCHAPIDIFAVKLERHVQLPILVQFALGNIDDQNVIVAGNSVHPRSARKIRALQVVDADGTAVFATQRKMKANVSVVQLLRISLGDLGEYISRFEIQPPFQFDRIAYRFAACNIEIFVSRNGGVQAGILRDGSLGKRVGFGV